MTRVLGLVFGLTGGFTPHMHIPAQITHQGEALQGRLIDGCHAVENEEGGEEDGEREKFEVLVQVPLAGPETLGVQKDRMQVFTYLDGSPPHPDPTSAALHGTPNLEAVTPAQ